MKQISCGFLVRNKGKYLAMLPTWRTPRQFHNYDIPKGLKEEGETDFQTAVRELYEETGINLNEVPHSEFIDYGVHDYIKYKKDIHIFGVDVELPDDFKIVCESTFTDDYGRELPEMCGHLWTDNLDYYFKSLEDVLHKILN